MWSGAISFGLVNVPDQALPPRVSKKTVRFHQINGGTGNRIAQKRTDAVTARKSPTRASSKGYELTRDQHVDHRAGRAGRIDPEKSLPIDIEDFVDLARSTPSTTTTRTTSSRTRRAAKAYGCC